MSEPPPKVFAAIAAVMSDISREGISKDRRNKDQGYNFRGIDEVYNALSPILAKHKLCILPRVLARSMTERQTRSGGALFNVVVEAEFEFVSAEDGSKHTIRTFGEAMDTADKATNKAMSAAYKYAAMQAFCIPTEGDNDAEGTTHEVAPQQEVEPPVPVHSDVLDAHINTIKAAGDVGALQAAFGVAWKAVADRAQRAQLKSAYDGRKLDIEAPKKDAA